MSEQHILILDANAFISGAGLLNLGATHKLVTTQEVMEELRDQKTR
jgi:rRNA maturation endonuclease Nob1